MSEKLLNTYVHVTDPKTHQAVVLRPGEPVPKALASQVGDHCFETDEDDYVAPIAGPGQSAVDAATAAAIAKAREDDEKLAAAKQAAADAEAAKQKGGK